MAVDGQLSSVSGPTHFQFFSTSCSLHPSFSPTHLLSPNTQDFPSKSATTPNPNLRFSGTLSEESWKTEIYTGVANEDNKTGWNFPWLMLPRQQGIMKWLSSSKEHALVISIGPRAIIRC